MLNAVLSVAVELPSESYHGVPVSDTISRHGNVQLNKMTGVIHPSTYSKNTFKTRKCLQTSYSPGISMDALDRTHNQFYRCLKYIYK